MELLKRTYTLPAETLNEFEQTVAPGKRSSTIDAILRDWLADKRRAELRREIIEGCQAMADVYVEIEREYHPLEEEVQRAFPV